MCHPAWGVSLLLMWATAAILAAGDHVAAAAELPGRRLLQSDDESIVLASIRDEGGKHLCSGVPVAPDAILTAAHCVQTQASSIESVHIKMLRAESGWDHAAAQVIPILRVITHPSYNPVSLDNDAALVLLDGQMTNKPFPLASSSSCFESGIDCMVRVLDWDDTASVVTLRAMPRQTCQDLLPLTITENMICAENLQQEICASDRGAPLLLGNSVVGIASTGFGCGGEGNPEVYTSVPALRVWIEMQLGVEKVQSSEDSSTEQDGLADGDMESMDNGNVSSEELDGAPGPSVVVDSQDTMVQPTAPPAPPPTPPLARQVPSIPSPPPPFPVQVRPRPTPAPQPPRTPGAPATPAEITQALRNAIFSGDVQGTADILSGTADVDALASGLRVSGRRLLAHS